MTVDKLSKEEQKQLWVLLNNLRAVCINDKHEPALAMVGLCQMMGYILAMGDRDVDKEMLYQLIVEDIDLAYDIAVSVSASADALDKMKGKSTGVKGDSNDRS